jgi:hypothetical protein
MSSQAKVVIRSSYIVLEVSELIWQDKPERGRETVLSLGKSHFSLTEQRAFRRSRDCVR